MEHSQAAYDNAHALSRLEGGQRWLRVAQEPLVALLELSKPPPGGHTPPAIDSISL